MWKVGRVDGGKWRYNWWALNWRCHMWCCLTAWSGRVMWVMATLNRKQANGVRRSCSSGAGGKRLWARCWNYPRREDKFWWVVDFSSESCGGWLVWKCFYGVNFFVCVCYFRTAPMAYRGSQARGQIGASAASLHHSHSNAGSELHLQPNNTARPGIEPASLWILVRFVNYWATKGIPVFFLIMIFIFSIIVGTAKWPSGV